jgi:release factor glutamine methyltransferase
VSSLRPPPLEIAALSPKDSDLLEEWCHRLADERFARAIGSAPSPELIRSVVQQRLQGAPLAHCLRSTRFLGSWYHVDSKVLAPHPATELLTLLTLHVLAGKFGSASPTGIEIGLGCGVVSLSLLKSFPGLSMIGTELSPAAVEVARCNLLLHQAQDRLEVLRVETADRILEPLLERAIQVDFLVSNPPYLCLTDDISAEYRQHMPEEALYPADPTGMRFYAAIARQGASVLKPNGTVILECRTARTPHVAGLFQEAGYQTQILSAQDLASFLDLGALHPSDRVRRFDNHRYLLAELG